MKQWLANGLIAAYLGTLGYGLVSHTLGFKTTSHPAMYFIVWDMYCGWATYETRLHAVAEGESGAYYELSPPPWGKVAVFGDLGRWQYDVRAEFSDELATCVLRHTEHEPIRQVLIVQECWSKKYNLSDELWRRRYDEPREPQSYYSLRAVMTPDGSHVQRYTDWGIGLAHRAVLDNPRLVSDMTKGRPFIAIDRAANFGEGVLPTSYSAPYRRR